MATETYLTPGTISNMTYALATAYLEQKTFDVEDVCNVLFPIVKAAQDNSEDLAKLDTHDLMADFMDLLMYEGIVAFAGDGDGGYIFVEVDTM